jgi:signal transduction histidine kinase
MKARQGSAAGTKPSQRAPRIPKAPSRATTNRDVTQRKELEDTLRKRVEELALADRQKNEFLAMLAHELRNPLAPLRNAARILKVTATDENAAEKARQIIERQVENISRLVDDLLDAARYASGQVQLRLEPLDLRTIVQDAVEVMRPEFETRRQQLTLALPSQPVPIRGDSTRLDQIFGNLLNNAGKYTHEGGSVQVQVELVAVTADTDPAEALIRVRDNGEGIDAKLLPRVFDLFTQADNSLTRTRGGLGIGLNLVRALVARHGGSVNAHSEGAGQGSEFIVRLPLRSSP